MDRKFARHLHWAAAIGLATFLRFALDPILQNRLAFVTFWVATGYVVWRQGLWPALAATAVGYFVGVYFFTEPRSSVAFDDLLDGVVLLAYLSVSAIICALGAVMHKSQRLLQIKADEAVRKSEVLNREVQERMKVEVELKSAQGQLKRHAEQLEKCVADRTAHLEETIHSLEGVLYHIAHDLRAPLRSIEGFSHSIRTAYETVLDESALGDLRRIADSAVRMDGLIHDLLAYGKVGRQELTFGAVNLECMLKKCITSLGDEIATKNATIEIISPLPTVEGDSGLLEQLFYQLLSNAIKFVQPTTQPHVRIWAESRGSKSRIFIQDNGIGIAEEYHQKVFLPFERVCLDHPGAGIGLAIAKKAIQRLGGRIGLESDLGKGSCFWVELNGAPIVQD